MASEPHTEPGKHLIGLTVKSVSEYPKQDGYLFEFTDGTSVVVATCGCCGAWLSDKSESDKSEGKN